MPEEGISYVDRNDLLTFEEWISVTDVLACLGIKKIRITGGEPFVRRDLMDLLTRLTERNHFEIHMTTNGTLTLPHVGALVNLGLASVNLSLDTLDRQRFLSLTRRDRLPEVLQTLDALLRSGIRTKVNMVVLDGRNTQDIVPMAQLAERHALEVRFIEEMPFNGGDHQVQKPIWHHGRIFDQLLSAWPDLVALPRMPGGTASLYQVPGWPGKLGIIAAYSRTFCGTCNRLRITPEGLVRTCLYDQGIFNVRDLLRQGATDEQLRETFVQVVGNRARDGFEAEGRRTQWPSESMATIGG